jgi:hypothetical protein
MSSSAVSSPLPEAHDQDKDELRTHGADGRTADAISTNLSEKSVQTL